MLSFLKRIFVTIKIFLRGARNIEEYDSNGTAYQKLKKYGLIFWSTTNGCFITEGNRILLEFGYGLELIYSEKTEKVYMRIYKDNFLFFHEINHKVVTGNNPEDEFEINELKELFVTEATMQTKILKEVGTIIFSRYSHYVIYNFWLDKLIKKGPGRCIYLKNLNLFMIIEGDEEANYMALKPQIDPEEGLIECEEINISLYEEIEDSFGYQKNGNNILIIKRNGNILLEESFDLFEYLGDTEIAGVYNYIAKRGEETFLISITSEHIKKVKVPNGKIRQMFDFNMLDMDRYVVIKKEEELILAYIDPKKDKCTIYKTYSNGIAVNVKIPSMDFDIGGIVIPITITKRSESEEPM